MKKDLDLTISLVLDYRKSIQIWLLLPQNLEGLDQCCLLKLYKKILLLVDLSDFVSIVRIAEGKGQA